MKEFLIPPIPMYTSLSGTYNHRTTYYHLPILNKPPYQYHKTFLLYSYLEISNWRTTHVRVSDSGYPTWYSFEKISNEIPFVHSFTLFLTILNFELQVRNHDCDPDSYQDNLVTFILKCNSNTYLSQ